VEFRGIVWSGDVLFGAGGAEWGTVLSCLVRYGMASQGTVRHREVWSCEARSGTARCGRLWHFEVRYG